MKGHLVRKSIDARCLDVVARLSVALLGFAGTACSVTPEPDGRARQLPLSSLRGAAATVQLSSTGGAPEADRVQQYLDARYKKSDVRHSFVTKFGEDIDCIDFAAQAGVRALSAMGVAVPTAPPPLPAGVKPQLPQSGPLSDVFFNGQPDVNGSPRKCPTGTVPQLRLTAANIQAAGGLDAYLGLSPRKSAPPLVDSAQPPDPKGFLHSVVNITLQGQIPGGQASLSLFSLQLPFFEDGTSGGAHSLTQTWVTSGTDMGTDLQTVEAGWHVDPAVAVQLTGSPDRNTRLFTYSTVDNYTTTGCYDGAAGAVGGMTCIPWIQWSAGLVPGMILEFGGTVFNGPAELVPTTFNLNNTLGVPPNWWIAIRFATPQSSGLDFLGFYPSASFHGSMQFVADHFQAGGEAAAPTMDKTNFTTVPMGSGACAELGFQQAGFVHDLGFYGANFSLQFPALTPTLDTDSPNFNTGPYLYDYDTVKGPGNTSSLLDGPWRNWFYYGGPGAPPQCQIEHPIQ